MGSVNGPRIGDGEIVSRSYERQEARIYFLASLFTLVPEAEAPVLSGDFQKTIYSGRQHDAPAQEIVCQWQARYRLPDQWVFDFFMLELEGAAPDDGRWYWEPGRQGPLRYTLRAGKVPHRNGGYHIALYELHEYFEFEDGTLSDDDFDTIGMYDPRAETENDAVKRIMPELERRLRKALKVTALDDADLCETVPTRNLPPGRHFDWTVRYQVLGESFARIAASDGVLDRTVSDGVHAVADLIGLTLRKPSKGGRPRKQRPEKRASCFAIRHARKTPAVAPG